MPDMCGDQANKGVSRDGECIGLILDIIISRRIVICDCIFVTDKSMYTAKKLVLHCLLKEQIYNRD